MDSSRPVFYCMKTKLIPGNLVESTFLQGAYAKFPRGFTEFVFYMKEHELGIVANEGIYFESTAELYLKDKCAILVLTRQGLCWVHPDLLRIVQ